MRDNVLTPGGAGRAAGAPSGLANAVIIGAQKAGTTALFEYLRSHPDVFPCSPKEPQFFSEVHNWHRGVAWYASLFERGQDHRIRLDGSTTCTMFPHVAAAERMAQVIPDARLIYLLRDPVKRMRSNYLHGLVTGTETRSIDEALLVDARYADTSRYAMQIEEILRHFPREQLLVLRTEEFEADPGPAVDTVLGFLGLEPGWRPHDLGARYNVSAERRVPRPYWRKLGGFVIEHPWTQRPVGKIFGNVDQSSPRVSRPLRPDEDRLEPEIERRIERLLRADLLRLQDLLGPGWDWGRLDAGR